MAEKVQGKKDIKKEALEAPVADAAEKVIEKNPEATTEDLEEEIEQELEGTDKVEIVKSGENSDEDEYAEQPPEEEKTQRRRGRYDRDEDKNDFLSWDAKTKLGKAVKEG
jgi:hypothetical protein